MQGIMGCSEAISTDTKFKSRLNLNNSMLLLVYDFQGMHPCMHSWANVTHNPLRHLIQFVCSGFLLTFSDKKMRRNEIRQERFMARHSGMW